MADRLERLEPYAGANTPILHRCIEHGEKHPCSPTQALQGCGLRCCLLAAIRDRSDRKQAAAAARYDDRLAALAKLQRLESYRDSRTPILHRCLEHGEVFILKPDHALNGHGLRCCKLAAVRESGARLQSAAADVYDARLAEVSYLQRLEPYVGNRTPILHLCLEHGEEHRCSPTQALQGSGLRCCGAAAVRVNTLAALIWSDHKPELLEPCQLYAYAVPNRPELVKPGIARDHDIRSARVQSRGLYGELLAVWKLPTRRDALLVEGAILRDPSIPRPAELGELSGMAGATEVRETDADTLVAHAQCLVDSITDHAGPWQTWALENVPKLSRSERIALLRQLAAVPEVP